MKNGQFPEIIKLGDLNGQNGFKLDGENSNDASGRSVGAAGDINGDGYDDILIGALGYPGDNSMQGRSYVVFGGPGVGSSGLFALSSLNGRNGFKIDGESNSDYSGQSLSSGGDFNGDGYDDLLIGAPYYSQHAGKGSGYVVLGGPQVGDNEIIELSNLNGVNGLKLEGEFEGDGCGDAISAAGDVNGDGVTDILIGAGGYGTGKGRTYVIFGDSPPVLINNSLSVYAGETIGITHENLAAGLSDHGAQYWNSLDWACCRQYYFL